jgi:hypothetical protein
MYIVSIRKFVSVARCQIEPIRSCATSADRFPRGSSLSHDYIWGSGWPNRSR